MNKYILKEQIDEGTFGKVYKASNINTNKTYAIKLIKYTDKYHINNISNEIKFLKSVKHANIIEIISYQHTPEHTFIIFPLCLGNLHTINFKIEKNKAILEILSALEYLHSQKIIHRDLKPQNILVSEDGAIKIADFGSAILESNVTTDDPCYYQSLWYRAPEILLKNKSYNCSIDMWSCACIIYEILNKKILFTGNTNRDQLYCIFRIIGTPPEVKNFPIWSISSFFNNLDYLLKQMLVFNFEERITAKEALEYLKDLPSENDNFLCCW